MDRRFFVLGPEGTHTHLAAVKFLDSCSQLPLSRESIIFCSSNTEALSWAKEDRGFCMVAIENSFGGFINESGRFWLEQPPDFLMRIIAERRLLVRHNLMMRRGGCVNRITKIVSHPQAISQCFNSIKRICPKAIVSAVGSTAAAAQSVSEDTSGTVAAIASCFAASIYGLEIVQRHVHDDHLRNVTRFHIIGPSWYEENDAFYRAKTAVIFSTLDGPGHSALNLPGSLCDVLSVINDQRVDISSIHSIPLGLIGNYAFYCEFACHSESQKGKSILEGIGNTVGAFLCLGSFPLAQHTFQ